MRISERNAKEKLVFLFISENQDNEPTFRRQKQWKEFYWQWRFILNGGSEYLCKASKRKAILQTIDIQAFKNRVPKVELLRSKSSTFTS